MLDQAIDALKTFDWGSDPKILNPINEAIIETHGQDDARGDLEKRLVAVLSSDVPLASKDFVCRKLMVIGTAESVPTLAKLLPQKEHSHMARYALERIPAKEAAQALRDALPNVNDELKIGVIGSLGVRQDSASVQPLASLLGSEGGPVAVAAACALGAIRSERAAEALSEVKPKAAEAKQAATDASLSCADGLLADGKNAEALAIFKSFISADHPKHVRLAATRGMLACAGKTE